MAAARLPRRLAAVRSVAKKLVWTGYEARLVQTPWRYALRELVRPRLADYTLRGHRGRISLRHRSGDIDIFRKFYAYGYYDWPAEVITALQGVGRPLNVLDLGANIGFFQVHARGHLPIASITGFEPDPDNAEVLERTCAANGGDWHIVRACAANRDGMTAFSSGQKNFSRIASSGDCIVPTIDVFPYIARADLVKMNIEGSEWEILKDARIADTDTVWIVEYHRLRNPEHDITALVQRLFERCGYRTRIAMSHENNGLIWAFRGVAS
jgi:FkbM family methyltransferase